jgi:hypothetical protein
MESLFLRAKVSLRAIAANLTARGVRTRRDEAWMASRTRVGAYPFFAARLSVAYNELGRGSASARSR